MRRILVPLDGSKLAEAIFPDALRLAGPSGGLILVREARTREAVSAAEHYLAELAEAMKLAGVPARVQLLTTPDVARAIDEAAESFSADMMACATHGRGPMGRLVRGGVAWKAAVHSSVPILLRHPEQGRPFQSIWEAQRRIMVPLDGSAYAEKALPLAEKLALEWDASLWLVRVALSRFAYADAYTNAQAVQQMCDEDVAEARRYLERIAGALQGEVYTEALLGTVIDCLVGAVEARGITDVIMASHGRTGLSRVLLGSVADALIHDLHCPIILIPALASGRLEDHHSAKADIEEMMLGEALVQPVDQTIPVRGGDG